ncbi:MAG: hypothetical protein IH898_07295 [Planctomycetes bacterium]|nr:hypothetical protein [Planctomycetota bacterium]
MSIELLVVLSIGLVIVVAATAVVVMASRLGTLIRIIAALAFVPLACFCLFGFAASFEPGDYHVIWRVLYAVVFLACIAALGRLVLVKRQKSGSTQE